MKQFLGEELWRIRLAEQSRQRSFLLRQLRIVVLSVRGFDEDQCMLRASALTFYTLLSIVPILAMAFGVAKGFGFEKMLEARVREQFEGQEEVVTRAITFANNMLEDTKGGLIAGVGVVLLFWTIVKVLGNIERSFNDIWGIKTHRSLARKFSDYLSFMMISPILFIMSSSLTVVIASQLDNVVGKGGLLSFLSGPAEVLFRLLPIFILWGLFTFMYVFLPNGKVNIRSAFLGGAVAGTAYQVTQWAYVTFQVGVGQYNAIYGSFAALPLFLFWLQLSWLVVLYGAEVSFAHQNVDTYEFEPDCLKASPAFRRLVTLCAFTHCAGRMLREQPPANAREIAHALQTPAKLVNLAMYDLLSAGVVSEVLRGSIREPAYQPALDLQGLTLQDIASRLDRAGAEEIPIGGDPAVAAISERLRGFHEVLLKSDGNIEIRKLAAPPPAG
ncbi:YihY/virulence factor BrkB family protein [Candidatus Poribacteria bacterium]|nr:YihY/virulence factor BrkB family protein [Candidatus Poribacteria bacterium]